MLTSYVSLLQDSSNSVAGLLPNLLLVVSIQSQFMSQLLTCHISTLPFMLYLFLLTNYLCIPRNTVHLLTNYVCTPPYMGYLLTNYLCTTPYTGYLLTNYLCTPP